MINAPGIGTASTSGVSTRAERAVPERHSTLDATAKSRAAWYLRGLGSLDKVSLTEDGQRLAIEMYGRNGSLADVSGITAAHLATGELTYRVRDKLAKLPSIATKRNFARAALSQIFDQMTKTREAHAHLPAATKRAISSLRNDERQLTAQIQILRHDAERFRTRIDALQNGGLSKQSTMHYAVLCSFARSAFRNAKPVFAGFDGLRRLS